MGLTPKCRDRVTGATAEVASLKKAMSEAEDRAASERGTKSKVLGWVRYSKSSRTSARNVSPWSMI